MCSPTRAGGSQAKDESLTFKTQPEGYWDIWKEANSAEQAQAWRFKPWFHLALSTEPCPHTLPSCLLSIFTYHLKTLPIAFHFGLKTVSNSLHNRGYFFNFWCSCLQLLSARTTGFRQYFELSMSIGSQHLESKRIRNSRSSSARVLKHKSPSNWMITGVPATCWEPKILPQNHSEQQSVYICLYLCPPWTCQCPNLGIRN